MAFFPHLLTSLRYQFLVVTWWHTIGCRREMQLVHQVMSSSGPVGYKNCCRSFYCRDRLCPRGKSWVGLKEKRQPFMACEVLKMNHSCEKVEIFPKVSFAAETDRQQIIKGSEEYNFLPSFGSEKLLTYQTTYRTMFGVGARERQRATTLRMCAPVKRV